MRGNNLLNEAALRTICFHRKHSAQVTQGRSPDSQVVAVPACLPIPKNSGLLRRPLAAYSGGTVRDFHPLPFSLALTTSTSGTFHANISAGTGQSSETSSPSASESALTAERGVVNHSGGVTIWPGNRQPESFCCSENRGVARRKSRLKGGCSQDWLPH
jgi:hypothetical protein